VDLTWIILSHICCNNEFGTNQSLQLWAKKYNEIICPSAAYNHTMAACIEGAVRISKKHLHCMKRQQAPCSLCWHDTTPTFWMYSCVWCTCVTQCSAPLSYPSRTHLFSSTSTTSQTPWSWVCIRSTVPSPTRSSHIPLSLQCQTQHGQWTTWTPSVRPSPSLDCLPATTQGSV
jgi:hypothetical protein